MNNRKYKILSAVFAVALIGCVITINNLISEVNRLNNAINNAESRLETRINDIYSNVNSMLNKQLDILETSQLSVVSADMENYTAQISYTTKPKVYTPAVTKAVLTVNGQPYDMVYQNGEYVLDATVPLMERVEVTNITLEDNGTFRTQELWDIEEPRTHFITTVSADNSAHWTYSSTGGLTMDSTIHIHSYNQTKRSELKSAQMYIVSDGVELLRKNLERTSFEGNLDIINSDVKETVQIPKGTTTYMYTEVVDESGYRHIFLMNGWKTDATGNLSDDFHYYGGEKEPVKIYSPEGKLILNVDVDEWTIGY